jgi:hypothetical protein
MSEKFVRLSCEDLPLLPVGYYLTLNMDEHIVTLLGPGHVYAQGRFSRSAFRIFCLLLKSPNGAEYAELLACLRCSEAFFRKLLASTSHEQMLELLAPHVERWNNHLEQSSRQGKSALEKELKMVRRAAKERHGANTLLKKNGFALTIRPLYRRGYLLDRDSPRHTSSA